VFVLHAVIMGSITEHDSRKRYCPMLGHQIHFQYCREPGSDTPCRKLLDCWWTAFDAKQFLLDHYGKETIEKMLAPSQPKAVTLYDLIEKARKSAGDQDGGQKPHSTS